MTSLARTLSLCFVAGMVGALAGSAVAWAGGAAGIARALGVDIAPSLTPSWLYPRLVWGGLWGFLFALPLSRPRGAALALMLALVPAAYQLFVAFPQRGVGVLGLELGALTPVYVLAMCAVWGLSAWLWLRIVRGST